MKAEPLFESLKELAEKLGVTVSERNLGKSGVRVKSGLCVIKGREHIIIDKFLTLSKKNAIMARLLSEKDCDSVYALPAVREFLNKRRS
jgi:hypothetical protein